MSESPSAKPASSSSSRADYALITIVGSRGLQKLPRPLLTMMQLIFPSPTVVLLRHPLKKGPERFESMVAAACDAFGILYGWCQPEPGGRAQVFHRDISMVGRSDLVLAFFADDQMSGGTEHVIEKAMDQNVPHYSYGIRADKLVLLGSHDPDDGWGQFTI